MSALERYEPGARAWIELLGPAAQLAREIATTEFVPGALRNNPAAIAACVLYGDEIGVGPMQSLAKIHVIDGRPAVAAETLRALVLAAGHELWLEESSTAKATWAGRRAGSDQITRITWTIDDARRARLDGRQNWRSYPRAMLSARASAELVRAAFADVIGGLAALEEIDEAEPGGDAPAEPGGTGGGRNRRTRAPKRPSPEPAAALVPTPDTYEPAKLAVVAPPSPPPVTPATAARPTTPLEQYPELADELERRPAPISGPQRNKMNALFREAGIETDADRRARVSEWIGRPIRSRTELTADEASKVISELSALVEPGGDELEPAPSEPAPDENAADGDVADLAADHEDRPE